jgi:NTE family protein
MKQCVLGLFAVLLGCSAVSAADTTKPCRATNPEDPRPRIGLVLGGGGARGIAHVSVLKELERLQIPVDCIAGTSMGALVGGLYASGLSASEIEAELLALDWKGVLSDTVTRKDRSFRRKQDDLESLVSVKPGLSKTGLKLSSGFIAGENIHLLLERLTMRSAGISDFNALPIPYRAIATDINSGQQVVLSKGSLTQAMRASMSIPGAFNAVTIDGRILVDGGLVNQVPVDVARAMGADIIIAVDVGTPLDKLNSGSSVLAIANQLMGFMTVGNTQTQLATLTDRDILIQPALGTEVSTASFEKAALALSIGDAAAREASPRLARLSLPGPQRKALPADSPMQPIAFVELSNASAYDDKVFMPYLAGLRGKPLDPDVIEDKLRAIYGQYPLELATYEVLEREGSQGLSVKIAPRETGPIAGEFGLNFSSNSDGQFLFNFTTGFTVAPINPSGGEWRTLLTLGDEPRLRSEWYQPLAPASKYFSNISVQYYKPTNLLQAANGEVLAEYRIPEAALTAEIGRAYGNWGEITLEAVLANGKLERAAGSSFLPEGSFNKRMLRLNFLVDELDSLYLPRSGHSVDFNFVRSMPSWGADSAFSQVNLDVLYAHALGKHSGFGGLRYHETISGDAPFQSWYSLGGVTRFAGYQAKQREIDNYALAFLGYTYELGKVLGRSAVLGGTLERGRLWTSVLGFDYSDWQTHGSVYFGFDSWLGLLILGYGRSDDGASNVFIELGGTR